MYIATIKSHATMDMYGNIPEIHDSNNADVKYYEANDAEIICHILLPLIDKYIENDLSYGDVDYFDNTKCIVLKDIILKHLDYLLSKISRQIIDNLLSACDYAITNTTGIVIELWGA